VSNRRLSSSSSVATVVKTVLLQLSYNSDSSNASKALYIDDLVLVLLEVNVVNIR